MQRKYEECKRGKQIYLTFLNDFSSKSFSFLASIRISVADDKPALAPPNVFSGFDSRATPWLEDLRGGDESDSESERLFLIK